MKEKDLFAEAKMPWWYYVDWWLYAVVGVALSTLSVFYYQAWLLALPAGFAFWTFSEYWIHRSALHGLLWHGNHQRHHEHPKEVVQLPFWQIPMAHASAFLVGWLVLPWEALVPAFAGFVLGYVWFLTMHDWLHHADLMKMKWLQGYAIWHNRHHKLSDCNYGITTPVWDWLFRTSR